ncbi:MAG: hypothetical protein AMXMBFR13_31290 [Phycisphaerae bacterium]
MVTVCGRGGGSWVTAGLILAVISGCGSQSPLATDAGADQDVAGYTSEDPITRAGGFIHPLYDPGTVHTESEATFQLVNSSGTQFKVDIYQAGKLHKLDEDLDSGETITVVGHCGSFGFQRSKDACPLTPSFYANPGEHFLCGQNVILTILPDAGQGYAFDVDTYE